MAAKKPPKTTALATPTISLPPDLWNLLRRVALARAVRDGGKASASSVIVDLVERHRAELEREAKQ